MRKILVIIIIAFFLFAFPVFVVISMIATPISFINSLLGSNGYEVASICELVYVHTLGDDYLDDFQNYYEPAISTGKNSYDVDIPIEWLLSPNLSAEARPDASIISDQIDSMLEEEYIYGPDGSVIDVIYYLTDLHTYLSRLSHLDPWSEKWSGIGIGKIEELVECSDHSGQIGQSGRPEDLEDMLKEYDFEYPFHKKANINAPFGYSAIYGKTFHNGIDLGFNGTYGEPIYSSTDGVVSFSGKDSYGANVVVVRYGELSILYGHMENPSPFRNGDPIVQGDFIGTVGSTGNSTGPHLHFEIQHGSRRYDPEYFIDF